MREGVIRENAKWRRGSIRVQGEVDGVAWSWAGPSASASQVTDIWGVGDESPFVCLDPVAASIGLKILGRGKLPWRALPSAQQASSAPSHPITANQHPVIQQHIYPHCVVSLPCDCNFNIIYSLRIYSRVRISRFVLSSYTPGSGCCQRASSHRCDTLAMLEYGHPV
jgi:hypothetical protein